MSRATPRLTASGFANPMVAQFLSRLPVFGLCLLFVCPQPCRVPVSRTHR